MESDGPTEFGTSPACTLYDVAREAGVSTATVSRVVHGQDRVHPTTRRRVLEVIEALGYVPDGAAQSLAQSRKEVIGLVAVERRAPDTDVEREDLLFIEQVLRGAESSLSEVGWSLLISLLDSADPAAAYRRLQKISAKVDGLLVAEDIVGPEHLARLAARVPVALIAASPETTSGDVFTVDNQGGTKALVGHMVEQHGNTRFFYIAGPPEVFDARERRTAFGEALAEHPGVTLAGIFEGKFAGLSGQLAVREMLTWPRRARPDAIVCANDQTAVGAMRELQADGIRVPADVAVAGFDDIPIGGLLTPPLTTVHHLMA